MQHIATLALSLKPSEELCLSPNLLGALGPSLQGVLMEHVIPSYAAELHQLPFNPYSLYCLWDKTEGVITWRINTLTDEAYEQLLKPLLGIDSVTVRSIGATLPVTATTKTTIELKSLTDMIHNSADTKASLFFLTPTAFKSAGAYVFMPTVRLIFQNLLMHYNQVYEGDKEIDQDSIDYMDAHTRITAYNLHSRYYSPMVGASASRKIPGFMGTLSLSTDGPQALTGLVQMLLKFGEYAGVGIKTSMGMGGMIYRQAPNQLKTRTAQGE